MTKERILLATFILAIGSLASVCQSAVPTQDKPAKESSSANSSQAAKPTQPEPAKPSPETPKKAAQPLTSAKIPSGSKIYVAPMGGFESYVIAGPCHTVSEFFGLAESITGIKAPRMRASPGMLRATAGLVSVIEKVVPMPETYSSEYLRVNAGTTYMGDNAKARRELGYAPRPLREGLEQTLRVETASGAEAKR